MRRPVSVLIDVRARRLIVSCGLQCSPSLLLDSKLFLLLLFKRGRVAHSLLLGLASLPNSDWGQERLQVEVEIILGHSEVPIEKTE